jgi:hypothetical protein
MATVQPTSTLASTALPTSTALASPYDGTTPAVVGTPTGGTLGGVPTLTGLGSNGSSPQVNATNQTALAPNGDVNQTVTNSNQYTNKFYNIVVPNGYGGYGSAWNGLGSLLGSWNGNGNAFVDPKTGVLYVQQETGIVGWFKRLFRGY